MTPDRERDLLDANNRYLEEARIARRAVAGGFQARVDPWLIACFGKAIARDRQERGHRFLEEAIELVQASGVTASEAHQLVDYVFGRPAGDLAQESGGVSVTHAAFCLAHDIDMAEAAERELARVWTKVETIRAKQAAKPKHSPLPEHVRREFVPPTQDWLPVHRRTLAHLGDHKALRVGIGKLSPAKCAELGMDQASADAVAALYNLLEADDFFIATSPEIGADGNSDDLAQNHDLSRASEVDASAPALSTPGAGAPK